MPRECGRKPFGEIAIIVSLLAAGLALVLVVASLPMKALVGIVPDDAFYYLVVGRNLAATGVSTFDGQNLASGYHPGWMMLVTMAARFVSDSDQLVRIIVVMGFAFHILAGWLLYRCLQRFVPGRTAALAAGFWMFGYLPLIVASFALEASLYCVAFLLSYSVYLGRIEPWLRPADENRRSRIPTSGLLLFGIALGLCLWARTEAILLLACAVCWLSLAALFVWPAAVASVGEVIVHGLRANVVGTRRVPSSGSKNPRENPTDGTRRVPTTSQPVNGNVGGKTLPARKRWTDSINLSRSSMIEACRRAVLTSGAALAVILPWLLYSLHTFGTIRQSSGVMKTLWMQGEISGLNFAERLCFYASRYAMWLEYSMPWTWGGAGASIAAITLAWICLLAAAVVYVKRSPPQVRQAIGRVFPAVAYPLVHVAVAGAIYSACFADIQIWYLSLPYLETYMVLIVLGSAIWLTAVDAERAKRWGFKALVAAGAFTMLGLIRYSETWRQGYWDWQRDVYTAVEPVDRALPIGARVGCFNAGISGYFSRRQIINLDGLVNNAVVPYWQAKRFEQYLSDAHIAFIYDEKFSMARARQFSQGSPKLEELFRHPLTNYIADTRFLWTLKPSASPPRRSPSNAAAPNRYGRNTLKSSSPTGP